jgi:hypothetical protein
MNAPDPDLPALGQHVGDSNTPPRPFAELAPSGLLWLINAVVFHPRGYALALVADRATGEKAAGWQLLGDGDEPWTYADPVDDRFRAAEETLRAARVSRLPSRWVGQQPDKERHHEHG